MVIVEELSELSTEIYINRSSAHDIVVMVANRFRDFAYEQLIHEESTYRCQLDFPTGCNPRLLISKVDESSRSDAIFRYVQSEENARYISQIRGGLAELGFEPHEMK